MSVVFVGMGSNLGDRPAHLRGALDAMDSLLDLRFLSCSGFRRTEPVGGPPQPDYVNAVAKYETCLPPKKLLSSLLGVEIQFGRRRLEVHGPRTLDLDLLLYGSHLADAPGLQLPHPRMTERRFVMEPLAEIAPRLTLVDGRTTEQCLAELVR